MGSAMLNQLIEIVRRAGELSLSYFDTDKEMDVEFKNPMDLVTSADREVEATMRDALSQAFPDVLFHGEETGATEGDAANGLFIADPIDGTTNFVHGYPFYSVSLAFRRQGETVCGLVYCPPLDQLFWAERGHGAFLNGKPVHVSANRELRNAVLATGFACVRQGVKPDTVPILAKMVYLVRDIHRDGSAALDLCYVASGKCDLFWELNLNAWDVAAGVLILEEAGGRVSDFSNGDRFEEKRQIVASNGLLHEAFLRETAELIGQS